jgi:hypothetical protein
MHCCLTRFVFDGPSGKLIGSLSLGSSSASRFIPLNRTDRYPAAFLAYDDATLDGQSEISGTPLAPILVVWRGKNFGLFIEAMKATTADSPSPYLLRPDFEEARLERIDALKIDIEGYEDRALLPFFAEASKSLWPRLLILERSERDWATDLMGALTKSGYRQTLTTQRNYVMQLA